ncbi:unnamed protein product [Prunus armeniaca]|uniref:tRNase Z endonuclease domain-containing protein n=1 Tax=Prunus armeniaca TaxID=36596 RepID=A0A6J5X073_PRUAR|nr:unnamed protein product [Prunus armeniaca]
MQLNTVAKHSEMTKLPSLFTVLQTHFSHQHSEITGNDVRGWSTVGDYLEASIFIGVACVDLLLRIELQLSLTDLDDEKELRKLLGTGMDTQDTSPSMLLFFDKQRFIFNAGEGLQRFCTEHKIKLSKV